MDLITPATAERIIRDSARQYMPDVRVLRNALHSIRRALVNDENLSQDVKFWIAECERLLADREDILKMLNDKCKEIRHIVKKK